MPDTSEPTGVERLTNRERDCLRLVRRDRDSFEIARMLGISPGVVDNHIKSARKKLSGVTRFEAARLLAEYEAAIPRRDIPPLDVAPGPFPPDPEPPAEPEAEPGRDRVQEERAVFGTAEPASLLERPIDGASLRNRLTGPQRVMVILLLFAMLGIGSVAALTIPFLLDSLRRH